ncbi:hypothetical protein KB236_06810 [Levilactobacillus brevis]|uniref:Uncharacterized protein n=1 Tax=Levilactobacillus hammesii TaxID=267633 RepID=A0A921JWH5_9LACO|nr:hypothetical protein KB236_06810 [Levilactobacillus brevis]HJE87053.1 hypothetical protein [Levilactobacillus hammesii]
MTKHHQAYHSPYAAMLTNERFALATRLAAQYHLDESQVMFAYLQITATVAEPGKTVTARQREIDRRFQAFLEDAGTPKPL